MTKHGWAAQTDCIDPTDDPLPDAAQSKDIRAMLPESIMHDCDTLANTGRIQDLEDVSVYVDALLKMKAAAIARQRGPVSRHSCEREAAG